MTVDPGMPSTADDQRPHVRIVVVGHVDHGKSTLLGQLLRLTGALPPQRLDELRASAERRGMPLELSFALDVLQAERDQAVTIDVTQIRLRGRKRNVVVVDVPGHVEFLKNMVSGAATAQAAVLVVDVLEAVQEQTRRHAHLLKLLGISEVGVVLSKMDLVEYSASRFHNVATAVAGYLNGLGLSPRFVIPISARCGDMLTTLAESMPWYAGPTLLEAMESFPVSAHPSAHPLRLPVQDVYRFDHRRILVGRVETGILRVGDTILLSPSNRTATVTSLEAWNAPAPLEAHAGTCVGLTLSQPVFVERGEVVSHTEQPPALSDVFHATLFWLSARPLCEGAGYRLRLTTRESTVTVERVESVVDVETLQPRAGLVLEKNDIGQVVLRSLNLLALDDQAANPVTGRCVLVDDQGICAGGLVSMQGFPDQRASLTVRSTNVVPVRHRVAREDRERRAGHLGAVLWLTGLPASGKSTLAMAVEERLFSKGYQVYVLDGDNIRSGISADLGFAPADRAENIRRIGEIAALFADAGFICLAAFISPYRSERHRARQAAGRGRFHEIYLKADLAVCEARDPKGLYRRARLGELTDFTGVSAPYEPPLTPELTIETDRESVEASVQRVLDYVARSFERWPTG